MNPDYKPDGKPWAPYDVERIDEYDIENYHYSSEDEKRAQVGRVIIQKGLVGALVLSYTPEEKVPFKIKLANGNIAYAMYNKKYIWLDEPSAPAGIAEDGWYVPELGIEPPNKERWDNAADAPF